MSPSPYLSDKRCASIKLKITTQTLDKTLLCDVFNGAKRDFMQNFQQLLDGGHILCSTKILQCRDAVGRSLSETKITIL